MIPTLIAMSCVGVVAALAALWLQSRTTSAPTATRNDPPTSLDRQDFRAPSAPWLIAVFTSSTCSSCAAVLNELAGHESDRLVVVDVEATRDAALHKKYAIDSVPTAVVADATGDAKLAIVGPIGPDHRQALLDTLA